MIDDDHDGGQALFSCWGILYTRLQIINNLVSHAH